MKVSEKTLNDYKNNSIKKHVTLHFPEIGVDVGMKQIHFESMNLSENLVDSKSIEFVGCISSKFKIKVNGLDEDVKGKKIVATISTENTQDEPVTLFNGIVDSAMKQSNKQIKEIVAYDELYTKGNIDVASWYKSLTFPITLKDLRDSLFAYIGLTQVETVLPNDSVSINCQYDPNTLQALSVIKAVCQINGAFGIINREGNFEYRILPDIMDYKGPYPSMTLFPPFYPGTGSNNREIKAEHFSFYKTVNYEEFIVKPVDKLTIRQSENDAGVSYGSGTNNYIVQGNMFTYGLSKDVLLTIAKNIYGNVKGFAYHPFTSDNNGLPFLECGVDAVSYMMIDYEATYAAQRSRSGAVEPVYRQQAFYILNRELSGIQALRDSYGASGEEYQTEFITDLQTQIDVVKQNVKEEVRSEIENYDFTDQFADFTYDKTSLDEKFDNMNQLNVLSVAALPANPDPNTIYLIQGKVTVN